MPVFVTMNGVSRSTQLRHATPTGRTARDLAALFGVMLELLAKAGEVVKVGQGLLVIEVAGESEPATAQRETKVNSPPSVCRGKSRF